MTQETAKKIGEMIRKHREKKGMTQLELSQKLGYGSTQFVSLFERGMSKVPLNKVSVLCNAIGMNKKKLRDIIVDSTVSKIDQEIG